MLIEKFDAELARLVDAMEKYEPGTVAYSEVVSCIERVDIVRDRHVMQMLAMREMDHGCTCGSPAPMEQVITEAVTEALGCTPVPAEEEEKPDAEEPKPKKTKKTKKAAEPKVEEAPVAEEPVEPAVVEPVPEEYTFIQVRGIAVEADKVLPEGALAELIKKHVPEGKQPKLSAIHPDSYPVFVDAVREAVRKVTDPDVDDIPF